MERAFRVRPMGPLDGPALDALLRGEPETDEFRITTRYRIDVHQALTIQHPDVVGVVAESDDTADLVGMGTVFFGQARAVARTWPIAMLENLKVHHAWRRRGIGRTLATWRLDEATRRFGEDGLVWTGVESSNAASLSTAAAWATQVLGPLRIVIGRTTARESRGGDLEVRAPTDAELEEVVAGIAGAGQDHAVRTDVSAAGLASLLAPTALGVPFRRYRVALTPGRRVVGGAMVTERFTLMEDHLEHVPLPLRIVGRLTRMLPAGAVIRSVEVSLAWHASDRLDAAAALWETIRYEWHDRCTNVVAIVDPRTTLAHVFVPARGPGPRPELLVPIRSPVTIDADRPIDLWR
jgi:GNAT superfamily N-acetyltransferase